jgi:hypothetical protein
MVAIEKINNEWQQLNRELTNITLKLEQYKSNTKYILFNILTNEYININCEFEKLSKMIEYLIYIKYTNSKKNSDEQFKKNNKIIWDKYFK